MGKKIVKPILVILLLLLLVVGGMLLYLTATEYRPEERLAIANDGSASKKVLEGEPYRILTWNIGFGAFSDTADFFMDGGKSVQPATLSGMIVNLDAMELVMRELSPDMIFLQEVDINSKRSYHLDQFDQLYEGLRQPVDLIGIYAANFRVNFVPYPFPNMIGKVDSGIVTLSSLELTASSERIQLPVSFGWPVRTANLKRCLLVSRAPVLGTDKELVLVNLHLEAYDDGEGKIAQTGALRDFLQAEADKGNYVIAGGDFNQVFSSYGNGNYPVYEGNWAPGTIDTGEFSDDFAFYMDTSVPSCRLLNRPYADADKDTFQYYMIDGFIVSKNLTDVSCETLDYQFAHADHNPVMLTFTIPRENTQ